MNGGLSGIFSAQKKEIVTIRNFLQIFFNLGLAFCFHLSYYRSHTGVSIAISGEILKVY